MPSISVVICSYSSSRLSLFRRAIQSVMEQSHRVDEFILVIDHNAALMELVKNSFPSITVIENAGPKGLSSSRHTGSLRATSDVVAYIDDDAEAETDWIEKLLKCYSCPDVLGAGGLVSPKWHTAKPRWFPEEFYWVIGCSYRGLPTATGEIRNPIGCNMSLRSAVIRSIGGFRESLGRTDDNAVGGEETELFIRARNAFPAMRVNYEPAARVSHNISADREQLGYFARRCWAEGKSKALVTKLANNAAWIQTEASYVLAVLPFGILKGIRDALLRLDIYGIARAFLICLGLFLVSLSYVLNCIRLSLRKTWQPIL